MKAVNHKWLETERMSGEEELNEETVLSDELPHFWCSIAQIVDAVVKVFVALPHVVCR